MALQEEFENQGNWLFRYRSFLPLLILLIGLTIHYLTESYPENFFMKSDTYAFYFELTALAISLVGFFVRVYTVGYTPKNTSGRNTTQGQVADSLNTCGIYSIVRHPLYLGNFLMWLGPAILTGQSWFVLTFMMFYWIYYERIMYAEEQFLRGKFGRVYLDWAKNVPAFIPKFGIFRKPKYRFSWKKVVKKEKNGLFAMFLIFCLFDVLGEYIRSSSNYNYYLIAACIFTGFSYVVLKLLKSKTNILNEMDR